MASVRLEDSVWTDPRFVMLGNLLGASKFDAIGRVAAVWAYCTEKETYFLAEGMIDTIAGCSGFTTFLSNSDVNLAEFVEKRGLFRIKGTRGRIEWIGKLRNNSRIGGAKTRARWQAKRLAKRGPEVGPDEGPLIPVPVPVPVLSPVPVTTPIKKQEREEKGSVANTGVFIGNYCRLWKSKYGTNPEIMGKEAGAAKSLVKNLGSERATELMESYLAMNDAWFLKKRHDLSTLIGNLNAVVQFHDTGNQILGSKAHEIERAQANSDTWDQAAQILNKRRKSNEAV